MPKYRFQIIGPDGEKRRGTLDAPDRESAQALLRSRGLRVLSVKPAMELKGGDSHQASEQERSRYRATWKDRLVYFEPDQDRRRLLILLLIVLGLLLSVVRVRREALVLEPLHAPKRERVVVEITGKLAPVEGVQLGFHFPEVPLDIAQPAEDIADENGDFVFHIEFESSEQPTLCAVTAEKKGFRELRMRPVTLSGEPLGATLPPIVLEKN